MHNVLRILEAHGGAGVEAEPSKPQDEKTDNCESQAMAGIAFGFPSLSYFP